MAFEAMSMLIFYLGASCPHIILSHTLLCYICLIPPTKRNKIIYMQGLLLKLLSSLQVSMVGFMCFGNIVDSIKIYLFIFQALGIIFTTYVSELPIYLSFLWRDINFILGFTFLELNVYITALRLFIISKVNKEL